MRNRAIFLGIILAALIFSMTTACSQTANETTTKKDDSVLVSLLVAHDDIFGFDIDAVLGKAWFSDSRGPVGSPVRCVLKIDDIERFGDSEIDATLDLLNLDAIKLDSFEAVAVLDKDRLEFKFIVPQVVTVPTLLDFVLTLDIYDAGSEDYFEAKGNFQFYVNQGTPAT
jgi:hypothetical protein